jgi:hypothetical protein
MASTNKTSYSNSVIYKLFCIAFPFDFYIGCSNNFESRKYLHKSNCDNEKSKCYDSKLYQFIRANGGFDCWEFEILKSVSCSTKKELEIIECNFIKELQPSLNVHHNTIKLTKAEYNKKYHDANREELNARKRLKRLENKAANMEEVRLKRLENKAANMEKARLKRLENRDTINEKARLKRLENRDELNAKARLRREQNKEEINARRRLKYREKNNKKEKEIDWVKKENGRCVCNFCSKEVSRQRIKEHAEKCKKKHEENTE